MRMAEDLDGQATRLETLRERPRPLPTEGDLQGIADRPVIVIAPTHTHANNNWVLPLRLPPPSAAPQPSPEPATSGPEFERSSGA
jgi:hypothetical protein